MATLEQLSAALIKADAAGNAEDAKALADAIREMRSAASAVAPPESPSPRVAVEKEPATGIKRFTSAFERGLQVPLGEAAAQGVMSAAEELSALERGTTETPGGAALLPQAQRYRPRAQEKAQQQLVQGLAEIQARRKTAEAVPATPALQQFQKAKTFGEAGKQLLQTPSIIPEMMAESFGAMAPTMPVTLAAGLVAGAPGIALASGLGSAGGEMAGALADILQEMKVDITNPELVRSVITTPEFRDAFAAKTRKAAVVGAFDALSAGLIGKKIGPNVVTNILGQAAAQAAAGGAGEALGSLAAGEEIKPGAVLGEMVSEVPGAGVDLATVAARRAMGIGQPPAAPPAPAAPAATPAPPPAAPAVRPARLKDGSPISIESAPNPTAFSNLVRMLHGEPTSLIAKNAAGEEIGRLTYMPNGGPIDVAVREADRRRGVGTALYDALEASGGKLPSLESGVIISDAARALRASREARAASAQPGEVPLIPGMVSQEMLAPAEETFIPVEEVETAPEAVTPEEANVPIAPAEPIEGAGRVGVPPAVQPGPEERAPTGAPGVGAPERGGVAVGERPAGALTEGAPAQPAALKPQKPLSAQLANIEREPAKQKTPLGFYSALADGVEKVSINASSPLGWKNAIKGLVNKGQVKSDEVDWTGVNDWLNLQEGKVTKQQVTDYLKKGGVQVEETVLGAISPSQARRLDELDNRLRSGESLTSEEQVEYDQLVDAESLPMTSGRRTKYGEYTLPGGKNYREVLLTLPSEREALIAQRTAMENRGALLQGNPNYDEDRKVYDALGAKIAALKNYKSSHWEQPNVLAHIRVNDRTDADGKRVLFVEEIQSDWGQEGKKKGFADLASPVYAVFAKSGFFLKSFESKAEAEAFAETVSGEVRAEKRQPGDDSRPPSAPFVTKTEGWLNLALKRIMTMAADGGYDRVAFVKGEQAAERFRLDKQISEIAYEPAGNERYEIYAKNLQGQEVISEDEVSLDRIEDLFGKEIAEKIAREEGDRDEGGYRDWRYLRGNNLKVEAKGMRVFYDQIVPAALKKLLPKVGGENIKTIEVGGEKLVTYEDIQAAERRRDFDEAERLTLIMERQELGRGESDRGEYQAMPQLGFDVTDSMKAKVSGGIPLFSRERPSGKPAPITDSAQRIRDEQIKEYSKLRRALGLVPKKVAEGKADIDLQRQVGDMLQTSRELQAAIKATKPRMDSPEEFLAKALKEYSAGNISEDVLGVIQALYIKSPELLDGLMLSVRKPTEAGVAGNFAPLNQLVTLFKGTSGVEDPTTIRHEITHALEQMMTPEQRAAVVQAWTKAVTRAMRQNPDELHQKYFQAVKKFMEEPTLKNMKEAQAALPSYEMYQYLNPSEYWAVNAEPLLRTQLGSGWEKFKQSVRGLLEALKKILGFDNKSDVYKTFSQVMGGDKKRLSKDMLVDYINQSGGEFKTLANIQPDQDLLDKYKRPHTPMLDQTPIKTFITKTYQNSKEVFKDFVDNPVQAAKDTGNVFSDALLAAKNKSTWYGGALESRDFSKYGGQLRTSNGLTTASVALDNAIRSGNIGVEVITKGGIEYNAKMGNWVAVDKDLGMKGVYEAEAAIRKKLGNQRGTDIIQGYLEAKRSISIMDEFYDREAAYEAAKDTVNNLKQSGATPQAIEKAEAAREQRKDELESVKRAVSSVNMSEEEMREFAAREERHPELRSMMDNWNAVNQNLLKFWRSVGLLSQGRYEQLSAIKDYVPWYRIMEDAEDIHSPIQTTTRTLTNIGKEKLFKRGRPVSIVDFRAKQGQTEFKINPSSVVDVEVNGKKVDPKDVTVSPSGEVKLNMQLNDQDLVVFKTNREIENIIDNMTRNVMRMTVNGLRQYAANRIIDEYASRTADGNIMTFSSPDPAKGRFAWILDGKKVVVEIQDPLVADAIYGMDNINLKMWAPLAAVANLTRRSITLSGVFQVKQVFKDAPTAAFVTGVKNPFVLIGGVWKGFLTSLTNTDPVVDILKAAGIGGYQSPARTPEAEVKRRIGVMNRNVYSTVIRVLDHIGDSSDMAQRVAVYKRVMAETGDEMQAIYQAANVINFMHHGSSGFAQGAVKLVPFMGAYINSMDVLVNALIGGGLKGKKRLNAFLRTAKTGLLLSMTTILYCMLVGGDPEYDELDDQTKLKNIMIPGTKIIMPMNTGAAFIFKALPELLYNDIIKKATDSEMDSRRLKMALAEIAKDALLGPEPIPSAIKPFFEVAIDRSFFTEKSITPKGLEDVEAAQQYVASTSELGKKLSAMLSIPGTDGKRVINPIEADHLIRGIFGTVGAMAQWASNSIGVIAETRPEMTAKEMPVIGSFLRPEVPRGREDLFYDLKDAVFEKYKTWTTFIDRENFDEAENYLEKNEGLIGLYEYINQTETELKDINKEIRRLGETTAKDMTPKERRSEIEELQRIRQEILEPVRELRREAFND